MTAKPSIVEDIGERALLVPQAIGRALAANDRVKYYFALLQLSCRHALEPDVPTPTLREDREAAGLTDAELDAVIAGARREGSLFRVPGADRIHRAIVTCIEEMIAPLELERGDGAPDSGFRARLDAAVRALPAVTGDLVPQRYVPLVANAGEGKDSLHTIVLDAHRELNRLQASFVEETIGGASAYGLEADDRPLVAAFDAGVRRTAGLKFDHPGLTTTATRSGDVLLLQNDLGTTDAHVLVVRVRGLECTIIHADPHLQRARFLMSLLAAEGLVWGETRSREATWVDDGESYILCSGRFAAADRPALERFLERLGSRLVFLIDWNRARKRLRNLVEGDAAVEILRWAADRDIGHRAFLELGGERLVYEAVEQASPSRVRYGQRLDEILGREGAVDFLELVLRLTADGLAGKRSERLIRDEIRAELLGRFETLEQTLLGLVGEHAATIVELAEAVHATLATAATSEGAVAVARDAALRETRADDIVRRARSLAGRAPRAATLLRLVVEADDAADGLEESAFLLTLLPAPERAGAFSAPLLALAALLPAAARAWAECVHAAGQIRRGGERRIIDGFLEAVESVATAEHRTDDAQRSVTAALFKEPLENRQLQLVLLIAQTLEQVADSLAHCALSLRDHLLGEVIAG